MSRQFHQVQNFNGDVLEIPMRPVGMQSQDEFDLSMRQLQEEQNEIMQAYAADDFIGVLDGLFDLQYFLFGIFYKNGINAETYEKIFTVIHNCNMTKVKGIKAGREGFDAADAVKPESWVSPEEQISKILEVGDAT
ncbi:MAG: hypothetical protein CMB80_16415 [Flammeovirgaceae bacterium]|nr:hypothetical protein [Flammeovirgaceae bacterium]